MNNSPTVLERQALGSLLKVLQRQGKYNSKWIQYIEDYFSSWQPITDSDISLPSYYRTLKNFPRNAKREIIRGVLTGWNEHHNHLIIYQSITTLIYLDICDTVEYFFLQQIYNFLRYFGDVCKSTEQIYIQSKNNSFYTLRFLKEEETSSYGDSYGIIDFQMPRIGEGEDLLIVPWFSIINAKRKVEAHITYSDSELSDIIEEDIYPLIENEFAISHYPWIQSNWACSFKRDTIERGIIIVMHSLQYLNMNGE